MSKTLYWKDALRQSGIDYAEVETQLAFHGWEIRAIGERGMSDRLRGALQRIMDLKAGGPHISAEDGMSAALCTLDRARDIAFDALSDTAQQETPHHPYEGQEDIG